MKFFLESAIFCGMGKEQGLSLGLEPWVSSLGVPNWHAL